MSEKKLPCGLLVRDDSERPLPEKIADCCQRFRRKFGCWPTTVWLHAETLGSYVSPNGLKLEASVYLHPNHFLIGPLPEEIP